MPARGQVMDSVEDYLRTREEARKPQPRSAEVALGIIIMMIGLIVSVFTLISALLDILNYASLILKMSVGLMFIGIALISFGRKGGAPHRVTETTRYPQQTGEISDFFFQVIGEKFLWVVVAWAVIMLVLLAWQM